jgi:hypothetical protein
MTTLNLFSSFHYKKHERASHFLRFFVLSCIRSHHQRRSNSETGSRCPQLFSTVLLKVFQ